MHDMWLWVEVRPRNEATQARVALRHQRGSDSSRSQLGFDGDGAQGECIPPLPPGAQLLLSMALSVALALALS
jgi:hypothetical protein